MTTTKAKSESQAIQAAQAVDPLEAACAASRKADLEQTLDWAGRKAALKITRYKPSLPEGVRVSGLEDNALLKGLTLGDITPEALESAVAQQMLAGAASAETKLQHVDPDKSSTATASLLNALDIDRADCVSEYRRHIAADNLLTSTNIEASRAIRAKLLSGAKRGK